MNEDLIEIALGIQDGKFAEAERINNPPPAAPFTVKTWAELRDCPLPPRETFLGDVFSLGTIQAIVGQGGVGKSRLSLNLARNNVLGEMFCGLSTGQRPYKWLFIGNENSMHRLKRDIAAMSKNLTEDQIDRLNTNVYLHSLENLEDSYICLSDEKVKQKWQATVEKVCPDIIVVDPWGEIQFGDPNNDLDARSSLRQLTHICWNTNPKMGIVVLHHARTGKNNIIQAVGYDKGNFAKGSKALYSSCRAMVNVAPADPDNHAKLVMVCGKSNDAPPFETVGVMIDEETLTYCTDTSFNLDDWLNDVEGKRQPNTSKGSIMDVVDAVGDGNETYQEVVKWFAENRNAKESTAKKWVSKAIKTGYIRKRQNNTYKLTDKYKTSLPVESADTEEFI